MRCPECNGRLIMQAFWQGRQVNCTFCGAKLQRGLSGIVFSVVAGMVAWSIAERTLVWAGAPMEIEIPISLVALAAGYMGVHTLTLKLKPRIEDGLKLL